MTETITPGFERSDRYRKCGCDHLAGALHTHSNAVAFVGKGGPDCARLAPLVAVIKVVDVVIVEVDRLLHQPQSKLLETKIEIGLRVVDRGCDVMETQDPRRRHPRILVRTVAAHHCTSHDP